MNKSPTHVLINHSREATADEAAVLHHVQVSQVWQHSSGEQVVLLPHLASATHETRQAMADLVLENLDSYFSTGSQLPRTRPLCRAGAAAAAGQRPGRRSPTFSAD